MTTKKKFPGQIRIIGGKWRSRKLPVPVSPGLRPTTDRIRETLFNWLKPVIHDARCLDCFAGSGALGLEALSRYAAQATLLESESIIARQLINNLSILEAHNARVINTDTLTWLRQSGQPFDIIFLDPPFHQGLLAETMYLLEQQNWLAENARIYIETEAANTAVSVPVNWQLHREKITRQAVCRLYIRTLLTQRKQQEQQDVD